MTPMTVNHPCRPAGPVRVLIVTINYLPEQTGFGPHVAALARSLASGGHSVTVLTGFPFAPYWRRWPEYRGRFVARERIDGVDVIRLSHFVPRRPGRLPGRVWMEASFALMAPFTGVWSRRRRWDVIVYCGAQPSLALLARVLARRHGAPYVVSIQDMAARAAADVGTVRSVRMMRLLERFEHAAYRKASLAFVLCDAFRDDLVAHGYEAARVSILRSPIDVERIRPVADAGGFRAAHGIGPDEFVVLCAGSMGLKQGLGNVLDAATLARPRAPGLRWVLVGDGEAAAALRTRVKAEGLEDCVLLLPLQPEIDVPRMLGSADVLLLNQLRTVKDTVVPSKLLTYMAAGKPVIAAVNAASQGALLLGEAGGGVVVEPENPGLLAEAALDLRARAGATLAGMGARNRRYAEAHFDGTRIVDTQHRLLVAVAGGGPLSADFVGTTQRSIRRSGAHHV